MHNSVEKHYRLNTLSGAFGYVSSILLDLVNGTLRGTKHCIPIVYVMDELTKVYQNRIMHGSYMRANMTQDKNTLMTTKEFLTAKTHIDVPITTKLGTKNIEIRERIAKPDLPKFRPLLDKYKAAMNNDINAIVFLSQPEGDQATAKFLDYLTTDAELNYEFWLSEFVCAEVVQEILSEFFKHNLEVLE